MRGDVPPTSQCCAETKVCLFVCLQVMSLPSQTCAYKVKITETSFVVRAEIVALRGKLAFCLSTACLFLFSIFTVVLNLHSYNWGVGGGGCTHSCITLHGHEDLCPQVCMCLTVSV